MKKTYFVTRDIVSVSGTQTFAVEAESHEEAARIVMNGGGEFDDDDIEVTGLSDSCAVYGPDENKRIDFNQRKAAL